MSAGGLEYSKWVQSVLWIYNEIQIISIIQILFFEKPLIVISVFAGVVFFIQNYSRSRALCCPLRVPTLINDSNFVQFVMLLWYSVYCVKLKKMFIDYPESQNNRKMRILEDAFWLSAHLHGGTKIPWKLQDSAIII